MRHLLLVVLAFAAATGYAQDSEAKQAPKWFIDNMKQMVGTWETDNAKYISENEQWDAYGMEWTYGIGSMSLNGTLYGIKDGEKSGNFWEFKTFWNPKDGKVYAQQFGGNGTFGTGVMEGEKMVQTFYNPDGTSNKVGHKAWFDEDGAHHTKSFDVTEEGEWEDRRYYIWVKG